MSRVAMLEQRVDALEQTLRLQSVVIGRCLGMLSEASARMTMHDWLAGISRDARACDQAERLEQPIIGDLQLAMVTAYQPTMAALDDALALLP